MTATEETPIVEKKDAIALLKTDAIKKKFDDLLKENAWSFLTTVMTIVSQNDLLKKADPQSVFMAAVTAASIKLPINPNLWFAYIVPYNSKSWVQAQFQIGYKWFIQLAQRSWRFKHISVCAIYPWQLTGNNPLTWFVFDFDIPAEWDPIWYAAYFQLNEWFEKTMYMTVDDMKKHWMKFSQSYKKWYWLWKDEFDTMAQKTVLKLLLSKYAPLSVDLEKALLSDQSVMTDDSVMWEQYPDNDQQEIINTDVEEKLADIKPLDPEEKKDE